MSVFRPPKRLLLVALVAAATIGLAGCASPTGQSGAAGSAQRGGELVYLDAQASCGSQLQQSGCWQDRGTVQNLTDRLVYRNENTGEFEPWLADSWTVSDDGLTYTFVIHKGVTYSDGSKLDVASVKRNLDWQIEGDPDKAISANPLFPPAAEITTDAAANTVTVQLEKPFAPFLGALTGWAAGLVADATIDATAEAQNHYTGLIGSGPFVVKSEEQGKQLVLERREGYAWAPSSSPNQGEAYVDTITIIPVQEDSVRLGTLKSGQADVLRYVQPSEEKGLTDAGFHIVAKSGVGLSNQWAILQTAPFVDDQNVRLALIHGIDRQGIIDDLYTENWHAATSLLSPGTFGYKDESELIKYDPDLSNQLLDESGWTERDSDGFRTKDGERLVIKTYVDVYDNTAAALFQAIQAQWKEIGVEFSIGQLDYTTYGATAFTAPGIGVLRVGWPSPDPIGLNSYYRSGPNAFDPLKIKDTDPGLDTLLDAHVVDTDDAQREADLGAVQDYILEKGYVIPIIDDSQVYVTAKRVNGFFLTDGALPNFYNAWLAK